MKRVRCPKCDNYIQFDETKYEEGQSLVFVCDNCKNSLVSVLENPNLVQVPVVKKSLMREKERKILAT